MAYIKTIAAKIKNDVVHVPQRDIEMHPLEASIFQAVEAKHELLKKVPEKPSQSSEHEFLIEHGADYVKQKRVEWQEAHDAAQPEIQVAENKMREAETAWNTHVKLCHANGLDHDTYIGNAADTLTMPIEQTK